MYTRILEWSEKMNLFIQRTVRLSRRVEQHVQGKKKKNLIVKKIKTRKGNEKDSSIKNTNLLEEEHQSAGWTAHWVRKQ